LETTQNKASKAGKISSFLSTNTARKNFLYYTTNPQKKIKAPQLKIAALLAGLNLPRAREAPL
jgi:hypothetical protein